MTLRRWIYRGLGLASGPVLAIPPSQRWMRVLGYHATSAIEQFEAQIEYLASRFEFVSTPEPKAAGQRPRVWLTFDDGDPSVVTNALPILERYSAVATLFICPSVIDTDTPFWWQVVDEAQSRGVRIDGSAVPDVSELKIMPDLRRRAIVSQAAAAIRAVTGQAPSYVQMTSRQVTQWIGAGHDVGNHTWDHPLLNMCGSDTQRKQIDLAHEWLCDVARPKTFYFAYPNGNRTDVAAEHLRSLGYEAGLMFDHRLHTASRSFDVSRIRVNAGDNLDEFKARVSGIHPFIHRLVVGR